MMKFFLLFLTLLLCTSCQTPQTVSLSERSQWDREVGVMNFEDAIEKLGEPTTVLRNHTGKVLMASWEHLQMKKKPSLIKMDISHIGNIQPEKVGGEKTYTKEKIILAFNEQERLRAYSIDRQINNDPFVLTHP